jgi:hypothetical protein
MGLSRDGLGLLHTILIKIRFQVEIELDQRVGHSTVPAVAQHVLGLARPGNSNRLMAVAISPPE